MDETLDPLDDPTFVPWGGRNPRAGWTVDGRGCHIWTGRHTLNGYAIAWDPGQRRSRPVYRIRYEREVGPIAEGLVLDHYVCDNGAGGCCNPHHCRPASRRENQLRADCPPSTNASKTHCQNGHELVGDNLEPWELSRGSRICRICKRARRRAHSQKAYARRLERAAYVRAHGVGNG